MVSRLCILLASLTVLAGILFAHANIGGLKAVHTRTWWSRGCAYNWAPWYLSTISKFNTFIYDHMPFWAVPHIHLTSGKMDPIIVVTGSARSVAKFVYIGLLASTVHVPLNKRQKQDSRLLSTWLSSPVANGPGIYPVMSPEHPHDAPLHRTILKGLMKTDRPFSVPPDWYSHCRSMGPFWSI